MKVKRYNLGTASRNIELGDAETARGGSRRTQAQARGHERRLRIVGHRVLVDRVILGLRIPAQAIIAQRLAHGDLHAFVNRQDRRQHWDNDRNKDLLN